MTILRDVPLPHGAVAIRVAVTRLPDMPGWSKVETRSGPDCGLSLDDLDPQELHEPREVMRAALRLALQMLPPDHHGPLSASIYGAQPVPDRLADFSAQAMANALAESCASCYHRARPTDGGRR